MKLDFRSLRISRFAMPLHRKSEEALHHSPQHLHKYNCADAVNVECSTALHCAAATGSQEAAECLVKAGADLALADRHGK